MADSITEPELEALSEPALRERLASADGATADLIAGEIERRDLGDWPNA